MVATPKFMGKEKQKFDYGKNFFTKVPEKRRSCLTLGSHSSDLNQLTEPRILTHSEVTSQFIPQSSYQSPSKLALRTQMHSTKLKPYPSTEDFRPTKTAEPSLSALTPIGG